MPDSPSIRTVADLLVTRLWEHGVRHIFGYPGSQIAPIYDALYRESAIRHVLARDEQAAAFMADGYARATGKPGVCLAVCGPGVLNTATPLATSFTDSIPVLLISGQISTPGLGLRSGYYHENDQLNAVSTFTKHRVRIDQSNRLIELFDEAFTALTTGRPGPVFVEIPLDILRADAPSSHPVSSSPPHLFTPSQRDVAGLAAQLASWKRPLILAGGGVLSASATPQLEQLALRLGAPVFNTPMGKGTISVLRPLSETSGGLPWHRATSDLSNMASCFSPLFSEADGLLAIGCRFTQLTTGTWSMPLPPALAQIDIDPAEIGRHYSVTVGVCADAKATLDALLNVLPRRMPWAQQVQQREPWLLANIDICGVLRSCLPESAIVVADITRAAYILLADFPVYEPRTFLHPAGSVAMGYGIPAALGAKTAFPNRPVVAVVGDGCFLMSGMELATAVQEELPIIVILINDNCLSLIKSTQERQYGGRFIGVDLCNPDFGQFAHAFGVNYWCADSTASLELALTQALRSGRVGVIEVKLPGEPATREGKVSGATGSGRPS